MGFFDSLFGAKPYPSKDKAEVKKLLDELLRIGVTEDYLSERPGGGFNAQCRHLRTREIGRRLSEIGGLPLMIWAFDVVRRKDGKVPASHLEYAWQDVGKWSS
jgi:hypothetical protein